MEDSPSPSHQSPLSSATEEQKRAIAQALSRYWRKNLKIMGFLLFCWAFFSLGCGVLLADYLNDYKLPGTGYPLGFWFAQQGSIIAFVLIILVYVVWMNRLDRIHHRELEAIHRKGA